MRRRVGETSAALVVVALLFGALLALLDLPGAKGAAFSQGVAGTVARASLVGAEALTQRLIPIRDEAERRPTPRAPEVGSPPRPAPPKPPRYLDFPAIARAEAERAGIRRPRLFVRQIAAESAYDPCVRSPAGALGIAQIMPGTAKEWRVDPFDPQRALRVAAERMAAYERKYDSYKIALAAYNAGPGAVRHYGGVPPYRETRAYVKRIMRRAVPLRGLDSRFRIAGGIDAGFERRLLALQRSVRARGGGLRINETWRSYDEQRRLWRSARRKYGLQAARMWVAPPGCSNHGRGVAADVEGSLKLAHRLARRHGLVFPLSNEPWHVELAGIPTQSG